MRTTIANRWRSLSASLCILVSATTYASPLDTAEPEAFDSYRELTSVAPRRSNCAGGKDAQEIVVCGRRQENLRYRLPLPTFNTERLAVSNVRSERFALAAHRMEGGSGSCSSVGPNGAMGCVSMTMRALEEAGDGPGLIAAALTYLDPDE